MTSRASLPATDDPLAGTVSVHRGKKVVRVAQVRLGRVVGYPTLGNLGPYGDCSIVAVSNIVRVDHVLRRYGPVPRMTTAEALASWGAIDHGTGAGLFDDQLLPAWAGPAGVLGTRIRGWATLTPSNVASVKRAIKEDGALYAGIVLPATGPLGTTLDPVISSTTEVAGHALAVFGWTRKGFLALTWGEVVLVPYAWWTAHAATAYAPNLLRPVVHRIVKKPLRRRPGTL